MLLKKAIFKNKLRYRLDVDEVKRGDRRILAPLFLGETNFVSISDNKYINTRNCHTYFGD